jgi:hypothetical protein
MIQLLEHSEPFDDQSFQVTERFTPAKNRRFENVFVVLLSVKKS